MSDLLSMSLNVRSMPGTEKVEAGVNVRQAGKALLSLPPGHKTISLYQQFFMLSLPFCKGWLQNVEFLRGEVAEDG